MAMARERFMVKLLLACFVSGLSLQSVSVQVSATINHQDGPTSLEFYVHNPGFFTPFPNPTSPGATLAMKKGESNHSEQQLHQLRPLRSFKSRIITFDNVITAAGNCENSPVLGRAHGIRVVDKVGEGPLAFTWLFTATFNSTAGSPDFSGTLSFQGTTLNFPSSEFSDVTVTGGTGSFRFARGYATFTNFYKADEISTLEGQHFHVFLRY